MQARGRALAERSVTNVRDRYEELVALSVTDTARLRARRATQGDGIVAVDGMQPAVGHAVVWVRRDCRSGAVLLTRSRLSSREDELVELVRAVPHALPVPIAGVVSDGHHALRTAVATALPGIPHQLGPFP